jgi:hypothetical protein
MRAAKELQIILTAAARTYLLTNFTIAGRVPLK